MNNTDGQERIEVIKNIPYPDYEYEPVCGGNTIPPLPPCDGNDLMILVLEKEVNNQFAKPALLPKENERFEEYIVSGFGLTALGVYSDYLRTVNLSDYRTHESCYKGFDVIFEPDKHLCGESPVDLSFGPTEGDSGGNIPSCFFTI